MKTFEKRHSVDALFLIVVFLLFVFSAISVLIIGVQSYSGIVDSNRANQSSRAAVAYVREMVHQNDSKSVVAVGEYKENPCISFTDEEGYAQYIYYNEGYLWELYTKVGAELEAGAGSKMIPVDDFKIEQSGDKICLSFVDEYGKSHNVVVYTRSGMKGKTNE